MTVSERRRKRSKNGGVNQPANLLALQWAQIQRRRFRLRGVPWNVLKELARRCDDDGVLQVSQYTLAREAGCTDRAVRYAIEMLVDIGLLVIVKRAPFKRREGKVVGRAAPNTYRVRYVEATSTMRRGRTGSGTRSFHYATRDNASHSGSQFLSSSYEEWNGSAAPPAREGASSAADPDETTRRTRTSFSGSPRSMVKDLPRPFSMTDVRSCLLPALRDLVDEVELPDADVLRALVAEANGYGNLLVESLVSRLVERRVSKERWKRFIDDYRRQYEGASDGT